MLPARRLPHLVWIVTLLLALGFVTALTRARIAQVERVTAAMSAPPPIDAQSPTGYAGGVRWLIAPGQNSESYQWIAQTQAMIASGDWRLREVGYDNAPLGRAVASPSPYRWWLAALAHVDRALSDRPIGLSVERAALWADPVLLLVFLVVATPWVAWRFGPGAAAVFAAAGATLFPLASVFLPGCPDDNGLAWLLGVGAMLALLSGLPTDQTQAASRRDFLLGGCLGGIGLWLNVSASVPVLIGLGLGGLAAMVVLRERTLPWRWWSAAGASTAVLAWLAENAPDRLAAVHLDQIHPLYALAWLGAGELLARAGDLFGGRRPLKSRATTLRIAAAGAAAVSVPLVMLLQGKEGFLTRDPFAFRLAPLADAPDAPDVLAWLATDTSGGRILAVLGPLLLLVPAGVWLARRSTPAPVRAALALALGPVLLAIGFASVWLSWWQAVGAALLVLTVALADAARGLSAGRRTATLAGLAALPVLCGIGPLAASSAERDPMKDPALLVTLAERELAHWLARRAGPDGVIALAPPNLTVSLIYHGGVRGLGTPYRENHDGFRAAVRLAAATTADEAMALAEQRRLTHIVIPSWDDFLDEYARLGSSQPDQTLMGLLHRWLPPRWLRPVAYYLPAQSEFDDDRVVIFELTELQDPALSLCRLSDYFLDMGQVQLATLATQALAAEFTPTADTLITQARVDHARRDAAARRRTLAALDRALTAGEGDLLAWDRRVSLTLILAESERVAAARQQLQLCLDEMTEDHPRLLTDLTLFRFLTLAKAMQLDVPDPAARERALAILPPTLREKI